MIKSIFIKSAFTKRAFIKNIFFIALAYAAVGNNTWISVASDLTSPPNTTSSNVITTQTTKLLAAPVTETQKARIQTILPTLGSQISKKIKKVYPKKNLIIAPPNFVSGTDISYAGPNISFLRLKITPEKFQNIYIHALGKLVKDFYSTWSNFGIQGQYLVESYLQILEIKNLFNIYLANHTRKNKTHYLLSDDGQLSESISLKIENIFFNVLSFQEKLTAKIEMDPLLSEDSKRSRHQVYIPMNVLINHSDAMISSLRPADKLNDLILLSLHLKTIFSITQTNNVSFLKQPVIWQQIIHEMELLCEESLFLTIPLQTRKNYLLLWSSFIRPIQKYIIANKNYLLFENQLEDLNFSWNIFFQKFSKEKNIIPPANMAIYRQIDERWNVLLKEIVEGQP